MKEEETDNDGLADQFKQFRNQMMKLKGRVHFMDAAIPVDEQIDYFRYSAKIFKENKDLSLDEKEISLMVDELTDTKTSIEQKKYILSRLAVSHEISAYRTVERYLKCPDTELKNWAVLSLMEGRLSIESELSGKQQVFISSGLGGKDDLMRFFVLMLSKNFKPFEEYQKKVIQKEFDFTMHAEHCEIEKLFIADHYITLTALFPILSDVNDVITGIVNECNQYGDFINSQLVISNVKELNKDEINTVLEKFATDSKSDN